MEWWSKVRRENENVCTKNDICHRLQKQFLIFVIFIFFFLFFEFVLCFSCMAFLRTWQTRQNSVWFNIRIIKTTRETTTNSKKLPTKRKVERRREIKCSLNSFLPYAIKIAVKNHVSIANIRTKHTFAVELDNFEQTMFDIGRVNVKLYRLKCC